MYIRIVVLACVLAACDPGSDPTSDAGARSDAQLLFDGAPETDASSGRDAAAALDAFASGEDAMSSPDAFMPPPTCELRAPLEANTWFEVPDLASAVPDPCESGASPTLGAHYYEITVPPGHHVRAPGSDLELRSSCACGGVLDESWYQNRTTSEERLVLRIHRRPGGDPISRYVRVAPTPANGSCAAARSVTLPFEERDLSDTGSTATRFDRCGGSTVETRALWYRVDVPAGRTLVVVAENDGPLPSITQPVGAYILDGCTFTLGACVGSNRIPRRDARYMNDGSTPRSVIVAVEQGSQPSFTLSMRLL